MNAGEKTSSSPLDKPLAELTEEDIGQLTREDCRKFLKEKGMRRPSWNKSQAIQQVISLKALLEGRPGAGDCPAGPGIFMKSVAAPATEATAIDNDSPGNSSQASPVEDLGRDSLSTGSKEGCAYRRRDPLPSFFSVGEIAGNRIPVAGREGEGRENRWHSQRTVAGAPAGQMTIFYDGRINVYDGVSSEQARLVMDVASSSGWLADETPPVAVPNRPPVPPFRSPFVGPSGVAASTGPQLVEIPPSSTTAKVTHCSVTSLDDGNNKVLHQTDFESPTTRKASVQRYLEKKKDRFKGKKFIVGSATSSMEMMYLNQKFKYHNPNELVSGIDTSSTLPQSPETPARSNSIENQSQKVRLFIDLNGDGGENE